MKNTFNENFMAQTIESANNIAPDSTGADMLFVDGFLNGKMSDDFFFIARDFLKHHFPRLKGFDALASYGNNKTYQSDPQTALQLTILNIMYKAAKAEDPYAVELIKNLYKTYHGKEYQQLKRFSKISVDEIFSLTKDEEGNASQEALARILGMCGIYKIALEEGASFLYVYLDRAAKNYKDTIEVPFYNFPEGLFAECLEQVDTWLAEAEKKNRRFENQVKTYWDVNDFIGLCLEHEGYPGDYVFRCEFSTPGLRRLFAETLAFLRVTNPKRDITFEDVQLYANIHKLTSTLIDVCSMYEESIDRLFGINEEMYEAEQEDCLFSPDCITYNVVPIKKTVPRLITLAPISADSTTKEEYLAEIAELRKRLHEEEQKHKQLRSEYEQTRAALKEANEYLKKYENEGTTAL